MEINKELLIAKRTDYLSQRQAAHNEVINAQARFNACDGAIQNIDFLIEYLSKQETPITPEA